MMAGSEDEDDASPDHMVRLEGPPNHPGAVLWLPSAPAGSTEWEAMQMLAGAHAPANIWLIGLMGPANHATHAPCKQHGSLYQPQPP